MVRLSAKQNSPISKRPGCFRIWLRELATPDSLGFPRSKFRIKSRARINLCRTRKLAMKMRFGAVRAPKLRGSNKWGMRRPDSRDNSEDHRDFKEGSCALEAASREPAVCGGTRTGASHLPFPVPEWDKQLQKSADGRQSPAGALSLLTRTPDSRATRGANPPPAPGPPGDLYPFQGFHRPPCQYRGWSYPA